MALFLIGTHNHFSAILRIRVFWWQFSICFCNSTRDKRSSNTHFTELKVSKICEQTTIVWNLILTECCSSIYHRIEFYRISQVHVRSNHSNFQQNHNYNQVKWPAYDVIIEFSINSIAKLPQIKSAVTLSKTDIYKDEILPGSAF